MTASTTSCVSRHGGDVAASNPALLTYTRSPRAQAARLSSTPGHASPRSLIGPPATAPHPDSQLRATVSRWQAIVARNPPPPSRPSSTRCFEALLHLAKRPGGRRCARIPSASPCPLHARAPHSCVRCPRSAICAPPHAQDPPIPPSPASLRVSPPQERPENKLRAREWRRTTSFTGPPPSAWRSGSTPRLGLGGLKKATAVGPRHPPPQPH